MSGGGLLELRLVMVVPFQRILSVQYFIPDFVQISSECRDLISRIFVFDPAEVSVYLSKSDLVLHLNNLIAPVRRNIQV